MFSTKLTRLVLALAISTTAPAIVSAADSELARVQAATNIAALTDLATGLALTGDATFRGSEGQYRLTLDGNGLFVEEFDGPLSMTTGFDGTTAWEVDWNETPRILDLGDREESLLATWLWTGQWLLEPAGLEGLHFNADENAFEMTLGRLSARVAIDEQTHLPVTSSFSGALTSWSADLRDYAIFDGVKLPTRVDAVIDRGDKVSIKIKSRTVPAPNAFAVREDPPTNWRFVTDAANEVVMKQVWTGHLLVRARINGELAGWFVFDSGAGGTAVTESVASEFQLTRIGRSSVGGVGGSVDAFIHRIPKLRIGPVIMFDVGVVALDLSALSNAWGERIAGVVGYDLLARTIVEMTDSPPSIKIYDRDTYELANADWQELWLPNRLAAVRASFEGHDGIFKLDTGAAASTVIFHVPTVEAMKLLDGRETTSTTVAGVGGGLPARAGQIEWFELGGHRFDAVDVQFATEAKGAFADRYTAGNIGGKIWGVFTLVFDYAGTRIAFKPR